MLKLLSAISLKDGRRFGQIHIEKIHEGVADALYERVRFVFQTKDDGTKHRRERLTTANHAMATAQTAWNVVRRLHSDLVPAINPFAKMRRKSSGQKTRAATFDQLQSFVAACDDASHPSIGSAALIAWHWCVREEHIVWQVLDGAIRALPWSNYRSKEHRDAVGGSLEDWRAGFNASQR